MAAALFSQISELGLGWMLALTAAVCFLLHSLWFRLRYDWHKLPGEPFWPLVGDLAAFKKFSGSDVKVHEYLYHVWKKLGRPKMFRTKFATFRVVVICDPHYVQHNVSDREGLVNIKGITSFFNRLTSPVLAKNLAFRHEMDAKWKAVRRNLARAFSTENMKKTFPTILEISKKLQAEFEKIPPGQPTDTVDYFSAYAFEIISAWGMGVKTTAIEQRSDPFFDSQKECVELLAKVAANPFRLLVQLFPWTELARNSRAAFKKLYACHDELYGKLDMDTAPAEDDFSLAAGLKRARNANPDHGFTKAEMKSEAATCFLAGTDTSAGQLTWTLCCIAAHEQVQTKLASELKQAGLSGPNARDLEFHDLNNLPYLSAVVKEGLRFVPAAPLSAYRYMKDDKTILGYRIPGNTLVAAQSFQLNRHTGYYENPDEFDPDRWLGNELATQQFDAGASVRNLWTFGSGPRNCVGQRLGIVEIQTLMALLVGRFRVELADQMGGFEGALGRKVDNLVLDCKDGMWIKFYPRGEE